MEETMIMTIFEPSTPNVKVAARFAAFSLSTAATAKPECRRVTARSGAGSWNGSDATSRTNVQAKWASQHAVRASHADSPDAPAARVNRLLIRIHCFQ